MTKFALASAALYNDRPAPLSQVAMPPPASLQSPLPTRAAARKIEGRCSSALDLLLYSDVGDSFLPSSSVVLDLLGRIVLRTSSAVLDSRSVRSLLSEIAAVSFFSSISYFLFIFFCS